MKIRDKKFKSFALVQIATLVIALFAFAWMVGSSFGEVSADGGEGSGLPNIGQACGDGGLCRHYSTIKNAGDSCEAGSGIPGTIQTGLCAGDEYTRCCVPLAQESETKNNGDLKTILYSTFGGSLVNKGKSVLNNGVKKILTPSSATEAAGGAEGTGSLGSYLFGGGLTGGGPSSASPLGAFLTGQGTFFGAQVIAGGIWVGIGFLLGRYVIGPAIGLNTQNSQALGYALGAGVGVAYVIIVTGAATALAATGIGIVVAAAVFILVAKKSSTDVVTYSCYLWDAELGGEKCEQCNNQDIPCTEYQCHSLGQGCEFTKDSDTGQTLCEWGNPNDILPPQISAWDDALLTDDYEYTPNNAISPPNKGVKIEYNGADGDSGCAPAWTPVSFGIALDERAKCKYSLGTIYDSFEDMPANYFSNGLRLYNHSFSLVLPTTASLAAENITVDNGGVYEFYTMCQDSNGNANRAFFGIKFCIDDGPDNNIPIIKEVYPPTNSPFGAGQSEQQVTLYVNEPAECKWDRIDKTYSDMDYSFSCATSATDINARNLYECATVLDGLKDNALNKFYFRCKDQPWLNGTEDEGMRNENSQSYEYNLIGTSELLITSVSPNDKTIFDSVSPISVDINVRTDQGYDDGKSICSIRDNNAASDNFIEFFYGYNVDRYSQYEHTQALYLEEGDYNYTIRCCDIANNCDSEDANFNVEIDSESPEVIRIFKADDNLQIITNEDAKCVYSTDSCAYGFNDGIEMQTYTGDLGTEHFTTWDPNKNLYIKCEDAFGSRPASNECTVAVRPIDIPELK